MAAKGTAVETREDGTLAVKIGNTSYSLMELTSALTTGTLSLSVEVAEAMKAISQASMKALKIDASKEEARKALAELTAKRQSVIDPIIAAVVPALEKALGVIPTSFRVSLHTGFVRVETQVWDRENAEHKAQLDAWANEIGTKGLDFTADENGQFNPSISVVATRKPAERVFSDGKYRFKEDAKVSVAGYAFKVVNGLPYDSDGNRLTWIKVLLAAGVPGDNKSAETKDKRPYNFPSKLASELTEAVSE